LAKRKRFILGENREAASCSLKREMQKITTEKGRRLFLELNFNWKESSFTVTPDCQNVHRRAKIIINGQRYPVERFVVFLPRYALHSSQGIFILSGDKIKR